MTTKTKMNTKIIIYPILLLCMYSCNHVESKKNPDKSHPEIGNISYTPNGSLVLGNLDSNKYENSFFGFSLNVNLDEWKILNAEQYEQRLEYNKESLSATDEQWNKTVSAFKSLFTIERNRERVTEFEVQSISFMVENLESIPNVNSAIEYLYYTKKYCEKNLSENYPVYTVTDLDKEQIGGRTFLVQTFTIEEDSETKYYQKTYSAQYGNYLLNVLVNYYNEKELKENQRLLNSINWN